jgi:hypothetical protein
LYKPITPVELQYDLNSHQIERSNTCNQGLLGNINAVKWRSLPTLECPKELPESHNKSRSQRGLPRHHSTTTVSNLYIRQQFNGGASTDDRYVPKPTGNRFAAIS